MTGTQALLISGQISLPVSVSAVAAAAGIKVIDYAAFRAQFENSLDDICRMVSYAGFSMLADGRMVAVLNSQLCYATLHAASGPPHTKSDTCCPDTSPIRPHCSLSGRSAKPTISPRSSWRR